MSIQFSCDAKSKTMSSESVEYANFILNNMDDFSKAKTFHRRNFVSYHGVTLLVVTVESTEQNSHTECLSVYATL